MNNFFYLIIILFLSSCKSINNEVIDSKFVLNYMSQFNTDSVKFVSTIDSVDFSEIDSNEVANLSFENALIKIDKCFKEIDLFKVNEKTSLFLKSYVVADFVYASFGNQFLGSKFLPKESLIIKGNWEKYSLKEQYNFGIQNKVGYDCGMKTKFFNKLINKILDLKCVDSSIKGVHTFPIVCIKKNRYLIDPSDPTIYYNQEFRNIIDFDKLKENLDQLTFIKSERQFGPNRFLISEDFFENYFNNENGIKSNFINFSLTQKDLINSLKPVCFKSQFESKVDYYFINDSINKLIIKYKQRSFGSSLSKASIRRDYLNVNCTL